MEDEKEEEVERIETIAWRFLGRSRTGKVTPPTYLYIICGIFTWPS
jgi:hypothetical protein